MRETWVWSLGREIPWRRAWEIKPVNPKGNQPWIFVGRTDAEAEAPFLWPSDVKNQLIGKDPDAGKDWRWEEKGMTEDEMVGWHHWLNGQEFEQALADGEGQESFACCSPWGCKELDTAEWLNDNNKPDSWGLGTTSYTFINPWWSALSLLMRVSEWLIE